VLGLLTAAVLAAAALLAPYGDAEELFRFADELIDESSGLVVSSTADDVLFTHNDSGGQARLFAVDGQGRTLTTYELPGVQARDWEDLARGPDEQGRSSLWIGDIGDNHGVRDGGILVHRLPEPAVGRDGATVTTPAPTSFRLVYPDRPRDAETLLVHPRTGRLYVVGKAPFGRTGVYAAPERLDPAAPNVLERVAAVAPRLTGTAGGPDIGSVAQLLFTGGDVAPDGSRVVLRTYTDLYEWAVPGEDVAAAFATEPVVSPLPPTRQGEAVGYGRDGRSVLVSSEGAGAPVHRLVQQGAAPPAGVPQPDPGADREPAPGAAPDATPQTEGGGTGPAPGPDGSGGGGRDAGSAGDDGQQVPWAALAAAGLALVLAAGVLASVRPSRRRSPTRRPGQPGRTDG
jgi:hypothetical protein